MEFSKKVIVANWKMNGSKILVNDFFKKIFEDKIFFDLIFCPPFTLLDYSNEVLHSKNNFENKNILNSEKIFIGAQNIFYEEKGSFTGEISSELLFDVGVEFVIIGHSERRIIFNDSDEIIIKKANAAINKNITPIICIGENKFDYENFNTKKILFNQLEKIFKNICGNFLIAYEPIWAIGTGVIPTLKEIEEINNFIINNFNAKIFYGGSINSKNYKEILNLDSVSGLLVGGESLKIENFLKIMKNL